jgi:predicted RNA-binding protein YlqC (UPF0109 family)
MGSKAFIDYVLPHLVDYPDEVEVTETQGENDQVVYEVSVHPEDMGKVIGKRGRIIRSLRTLTRAASQGEDHPASVEVVD